MHGGGTAGFNTQIAFDPDKRVGFVLVMGMLANLEGTERTGRKISGDPPSPKVVAGNAAIDLPLSAEDRARYEGTYVVAAGTNSIDLRVFSDGGVLMGQPGGQEPSRLLHQGDHAFIPAAALNIRLVFTVENGRAAAVALHQGGNVYRGQRKQ